MSNVTLPSSADSLSALSARDPSTPTATDYVCHLLCASMANSRPKSDSMAKGFLSGMQPLSIRGNGTISDSTTDREIILLGFISKLIKLFRAHRRLMKRYIVSSSTKIFTSSDT